MNDASTDNTGKVIDQMAILHPIVVPIHHKENKGLSAGWDSGLAAAQGSYVCFIDADLQNPPEEVWRLYRDIVQGRVDMVQGARSSIGRLRNSRYILSKSLNIMLNILFGMHAADNKSGFVMARRDTMMDILSRRFNYRYFHTFITVAAKSRGYTIKEIETLFQDRKTGASYIEKLPIGLIFAALLDISKAFIEYKLAPESRDSLSQFLRSQSNLPQVEEYKGWRRMLFELYFACMPLHKWMITRRAKGFYNNLKVTEKLSPGQINELQEIKLRKLMQHAYVHVPYYRELFNKSGIDPDDIKTIEDLRKLPFLTKDLLRENLYFELFSETHKKSEMLKISTSGSTGQPLVTYATRTQLEMRWASTLRAAEWTGWKFGDRQVRLWHQTIGMNTIQVIREKIDALFMRRLFIPAFEIKDNNIMDFFEKIRRHNPVLIDGYAESFNFLSYYSKKYKVKGIHPKAIMSLRKS